MIKETTPASYYSVRLEHFTRQARGMRSRLKRLSFLRLAIFLITLVLVYFALRWGLYAVLLVVLAGLTAFLFILVHFVHLQRLESYYENMANINNDELKALKGDYSMFEGGEEFSDPEHPFAADLDIFGHQSVFQYFNRSATNTGRHSLAQWFLHPLADGQKIRTRQNAVAELASKPEFRQEFLATGFRVRELPSDKEDLLSWVNEPAGFNHWIFRFYTLFIPILTFLILALIIFSQIKPAWLLLYLFIPFGVIGAYFSKINRIHRKLSRKSDLVKKYSGLLALLENEPFSSPGMSSLMINLSGKHGSPSQATRHLSSILDAFENRQNMLMGFILNFLFLWDIIQVRRTERWQALHRDDLSRWLEVLSKVDALCSLANFHFNHPRSIFPEISGEGPVIMANDLGHPLIPDKVRVDNPVLIPGWQHFTIITGANMAGKSTYLRTVGVNLVLAMAGSAVMAREMTFRPAVLITSIRTRDSLQKNESYFYAELKRLKLIMDRLREGEKLIILLDEILKGTNSRDKQSGSIALIEKLLGYTASGMVATHDLALGEMEKNYPGNITNKSFEVVIKDDLLVFDYTLKDGIARQMNATFLMKTMGITD